MKRVSTYFFIFIILISLTSFSNKYDTNDSNLNIRQIEETHIFKSEKDNYQHLKNKKFNEKLMVMKQQRDMLDLLIKTNLENK